MYNGRKLARVMSIHEDSGGYPSKYLSMDVKSVSERSFILVNGLGRHALLSLYSLILQFQSLCKLNSSGDGRREIIEGTAVDLVAN